MRICAAQSRPVQGDVLGNIATHKRLIHLAVSLEAEMVFFPELSLTGYEPTLAHELATTQDDRRLGDFQIIADVNQITVGVGLPTRCDSGICISTVLFQPRQPRQTYSKQYLHRDEEPFFVGGQNTFNTIGASPGVALAICYELSVPAHAEKAHRDGAGVYAASVAKTVQQVDAAMTRMSQIAGNYAMTTLMANCVGACDGGECGGRTSIWNDRGVLVGQLDDANEGILVFDTTTREVAKKVSEAGARAD